MSGLSFFLSTKAANARWDQARTDATGAGYRMILEFYLETGAALDAKYEELTGFGYVGHCAPYDVTPTLRFAMVDDPDGNTVLFSASVEPERPVRPPAAVQHHRVVGQPRRRVLDHGPACARGTACSRASRPGGGSKTSGELFSADRARPGSAARSRPTSSAPNLFSSRAALDRGVPASGSTRLRFHDPSASSAQPSSRRWRPRLRRSRPSDSNRQSPARRLLRHAT